MIYIILILLQVIDFVTTYIIFKRGGKERFYLTKWLIDKFGLNIGLGISKGICVVIVLSMWITNPPIMLPITVVIFYIGILINNFIVLKYDTILKGD